MRGHNRFEIVLCLTAGFLALSSFSSPLVGSDPQIDIDRIDLDGVWAFVQSLPEIDVLPVAGEVKLTSTVGLIVSLTQEGTTVTIDGTYCLTKVDAGTPLVEVEIPEAFVDSLFLAAQTASLMSSDEGIFLVQGWYTEVRGASLEDPENDPLPESADDPRIVDQDGDGKPGMTVNAAILGIVEGERYIANRIRYRFTGELIDPDTIVGRIEWYSEETTLGASNPILAAAITELPYPDPDGYRFVLKRFDRSFTCADLHDHLDELVRLACPDGNE